MGLKKKVVRREHKTKWNSQQKYMYLYGTHNGNKAINHEVCKKATAEFLKNGGEIIKIKSDLGWQKKQIDESLGIYEPGHFSRAKAITAQPANADMYDVGEMG